MAKFKDGDRVRIIDDAGGGKIGDEYTIDSAIKDDLGETYYGLRDGPRGIFGLYEQRLKLAVPFKVGDKVVPRHGDRKHDLFGHWMEFWAKDGERKPKFFYVTKVNNNDDPNTYIHYSANPGGFGPQVTANNLELYIEPSLTIEAGRYYKTRDGRKVGPMELFTGRGLGADFRGRVAAFTAVDLEDGRLGGSYTSNGAYLTGEGDYYLDIVAEWQEPATNDNAPKFKVGDRVEILDGHPYSLRDNQKAGKVCKRTTGGQRGDWAVTLDNYGPSLNFFESELRLVAPATSGKFKKGDRVECLEDSFGGGFYKGKVYTVSKDFLGGEFESVHIERDDYGSKYNGWSPKFFKLAEATPTPAPAIVCLIENGQPKPSDFPHVHPSRDAAAKEASRLAGKHKGQEFGVYELVSTVQQPAPVYEHEWQRLAVSGKKIEAIKELRAKTGITLKGANDAVEHWLAAA